LKTAKIEKNEKFFKKLMIKKGLKSAKICGLTLDSTSREELLKEILSRIKAKKKTFIATPNPEFIVFAQKKPWFKKALNRADFLIPDGIGLVWAGRILKQPIKQRVTGGDLAEALLKKAQEKKWRVGLVGARRGVVKERQKLVKALQAEYQPAKIANLEEASGWRKQEWDLIFACQGMGRQEKWLLENKNKVKGLVFIGIGGGLDFLAKMVPRAPQRVRSLGLEWFYRLLRQPWRWRRQLNLFRFIGLVLQAKLQFFLDRVRI